MNQLFPVLRCHDCQRVREGLYHEWAVHPAKYQHEVDGLCRTCLDQRARERVKSARKPSVDGIKGSKMFDSPANAISYIWRRRKLRGWASATECLPSVPEGTTA